MINDRKVIYVLLLIMAICMAVTTASAQGPGFPPAPVDTPVDFGATFLVAAAAGYGAKKLNDRKKHKL